MANGTYQLSVTIANVTDVQASQLLNLIQTAVQGAGKALIVNQSQFTETI
jgi:hypothetical protein